jgi:hypothetical protein
MDYHWLNTWNRRNSHDIDEDEDIPISMIVTNFARFSGVTQFNDLRCEADTSDEVVIHLRRPTSKQAAPPHVNPSRFPQNSTFEAIRSYMSTSIKFVRHSNVLRSLLMSCLVIGSFRLSSHHSLPNVWRRNEPVASDTIFSEVAAICTNMEMMAQIFFWSYFTCH